MSKREELEKILTDGLPEISGKAVYIWGTGNTALLYQEGIKRLEKENFFTIKGYCDNNSERWGRQFCGKTVLSPDELLKVKNSMILICSAQRVVCRNVKAQLEKMGLEGYLIDEVIFKVHAADILKVYDILEDEKSKEIYAKLICCRMKNDLPEEEFISPSQYFAIPAFRHRNPMEVFIDCGGYVGDTVEQYLWLREGSFNKIITFEPDKNNYRAMENRADRLRREWNLREEDLVLYPFGVGEQEFKMTVRNYDANHGLGSKIGAECSCGDGGVCTIVTLDHLLKEQYHFLKADIESQEYNMLVGAQVGIKKWKPMIAVCIYHNAADFFQIPLLLKSYVEEYKFAVRHHSADLDDTVLYAWLEE